MSPSTTLSHLKPYKAEAIHRIRINALGLFTVLVLSYLLPLPSLPTALRTLISSWAQSYSHSESTVWVWACMIEMGLVTVMGYNVLEASYAIKYPRAPLPPVSSKASKTPISSPSPFSPNQSKSQRPFKVLSPNSSPQPQRAFTFNPSASTSSPLNASSSSRAFKNSAAPSVPASSPNTNAPPNPNSSITSPPYAQSPVSTPSRVLHYTVPSSASTMSNASAASTSSEYLATPSPVVSAYRGRHVAGDIGRAIDGSYLTRVATPKEVSLDEN